MTKTSEAIRIDEDDLNIDRARRMMNGLHALMEGFVTDAADSIAIVIALDALAKLLQIDEASTRPW